VTGIIVKIASTQGLKRPPTERRTPIPEKITTAGEKTWEIGYKAENKMGRRDGTHASNPCPEGCREGVENVDSRVQPL
jgi:hypothetical protein